MLSPLWGTGHGTGQRGFSDLTGPQDGHDGIPSQEASDLAQRPRPSEHGRDGTMKSCYPETGFLGSPSGQEVGARG